MFTIQFIAYLKCHPIVEIYLIVFLTLINNPLASRFQVDLEFLLLHTVHFDKNINFCLFIFVT